MEENEEIMEENEATMEENEITIERSETIREENIGINVRAKDWEDAVQLSGELLVKSNYITQEYIDITIDCIKEIGPYIVIAPGLAISHSVPDENVLKTGVSLITLSEPIDFGSSNDPVEIVITLAAEDDSTHIDELKILVEIFSEENMIENIKECKTPKEIADIINGEL